MELVELNLEDKDSYNQFIAAQDSGSFLQGWEWGEWQERLGRKIFRYWILNDIGEQIVSIQLIKMPLPFGKYYLYAPYGPVLDLGKFSAEGGSASGGKIEDLRFLIHALNQRFSQAIFIRIEPKQAFDFRLSTLGLSIAKSANIQPAKTLLIDLTQSPEQLLAQMYHKTRYNIKLAQKHKVDIKEEMDISIGHGLYFQEAIELICQTAKRQGFTTYTAEYYQNLVDFFALNPDSEIQVHIYKAIFQNQLLAAAIMLDFSAKGARLPGRQGSASGGGTRTFLFGGSSEFHKNVMAPYLLHWQAMLDAKAKGFGNYDFWGIETASGQTPGFVRFKLGFGPQQHSDSASGGIKLYGGAYDIVQHQIKYGCYRIFRLINKFLKKISPA